ncbi:MAG TPA: NAD-dependent epimerase/dehydratase family protein [Pararhizobium sp.]|nr:NAD-dependent epimerase/dehydratase family protein [Pararhizobium sp.]
MSKTVLITGGCGFIGRYVAAEMRKAGYRVRILDNLIEQVHGDAVVADFNPDDCIIGDVRDSAVVNSALSGVDHVIHLAAEVGVGQSMYEVARYVGSNDLGTAVLLDALIANPVESLVVASSMSVYGEGRYRDASGRMLDRVRRRRSDVQAGHWEPVNDSGGPIRAVPTDEEKPVDLASIYALTKYAQERAVLLIGEAYDMHVTALRLFNVFGAGQALSNPYTGVLANFASRLANGQPPMIFEDGEQRRDFVDVRDVARAFRLAMERPDSSGQVINIGSGHAYTIRQVAELLADAMGVPEIEPEIMRKARAGDIRNCFADISRARELLGFEPEHRLEESVSEFVAWVRGAPAIDRSAEMKRHLEERGLVA